MKTLPNPVGWFEIYVQDLERARVFYQETLQVTLEYLENNGLKMWTFPMDFEQPGASGALVKMDGKNSGAGGTIVYFNCQDCAVEAARAAQQGGTVVREKMSIGEYGFIALILDLDGNLFGLHSRT